MSDPTEFFEETIGDVTLRYFWEYDDSGDTPWERDCVMAGCVLRTDDTPEPWQRILNDETWNRRTADMLLFDGRAFVEKAIKDGCTRAQAAEQLESCFEHCRSWLNNEWHYVGVIVRAFDEDDEDITPRDVIDSLWGIENKDQSYMLEAGREIADEIMATLEPMLKAAA